MAQYRVRKVRGVQGGECRGACPRAPEGQAQRLGGDLELERRRGHSGAGVEAHHGQGVHSAQCSMGWFEGGGDGESSSVR